MTAHVTIELALIPAVLLEAGSIGRCFVKHGRGDCLHLYLPRCGRGGG